MNTKLAILKSTWVAHQLLRGRTRSIWTVLFWIPSLRIRRRTVSFLNWRHNRSILDSQRWQARLRTQTQHRKMRDHRADFGQGERDEFLRGTFKLWNEGGAGVVMWD